MSDPIILSREDADWIFECAWYLIDAQGVLRNQDRFDSLKDGTPGLTGFDALSKEELECVLCAVYHFYDAGAQYDEWIDMLLEKIDAALDRKRAAKEELQK
jgi:hypothetical protein